MSWRSVRSATGIGVRLMRGWTRTEDHGGPRQRVGGAVADGRLVAVAGEGRVHDVA